MWHRLISTAIALSDCFLRPARGALDASCRCSRGVLDYRRPRWREQEGIQERQAWRCHACHAGFVFVCGRGDMVDYYR